MLKERSIQDFSIGKIIGEGAYGHVVLATDKTNQNSVAIKIISKKNLIRAKKVNSPVKEKEALLRFSHPNVISLIATSQDPFSLYFIFPYIPNGLLSNYLKNSVHENIIKHIFGQILLSIAHIHQKGVIHRDLKPENVLLDELNRVKLIDFGSIKFFDVDISNDGFTRGSFVGSVDYISPEILSDSPTSPAVDLWSFGCMLFVAFEGRTPFYAETKMATYQNIENCQFELTQKTPEVAADLIRKLLITDYKKRIGFGEFESNYSSIRSHPFFEGINWETLPTDPPPSD